MTTPTNHTPKPPCWCGKGDWSPVHAIGGDHPYQPERRKGNERLSPSCAYYIGPFPDEQWKWNNRGRQLKQEPRLAPCNNFQVGMVIPSHCARCGEPADRHITNQSAPAPSPVTTEHGVMGGLDNRILCLCGQMFSISEFNQHFVDSVLARR